MAAKTKEKRKMSEETKEELKIICYLLFRLATIVAIVLLIRGLVERYVPREITPKESEPIFIEQVIIPEKQVAENTRPL